jgi:hypothetical protein
VEERLSVPISASPKATKHVLGFCVCWCEAVRPIDSFWAGLVFWSNTASHAATHTAGGQSQRQPKPKQVSLLFSFRTTDAMTTKRVAAGGVQSRRPARPTRQPLSKVLPSRPHDALGPRVSSDVTKPHVRNGALPTNHLGRPTTGRTNQCGPSVIGDEKTCPQ